MMATSIKFLFNKFFFLAAICIGLQQIIVASSTLWISQLAKEVSNGAEFLGTLALFSASLVVVYLPGFLALVFSEKSRLLSVRQYIDSLFSACFGKVLARTNLLKDEIIPIASSESFVVFNDALRLLFELISIFLNVIFNLIVLSIVIEKEIIIYYLIGFFLSAISVLFTSKLINSLSTLSQSSIIKIKGVLYKLWDNIFIGNHYNYRLYKNEYNSHFDMAILDKVKSVMVNNAVSTLGMILMILPIIGYIFYLGLY